jgi:hypothetical protein
MPSEERISKTADNASIKCQQITRGQELHTGGDFILCFTRFEAPAIFLSPSLSAIFRICRAVER